MPKYTPKYTTADVVAACIENLNRAPHPDVREIVDAANVDLSDAAKTQLRTLLGQGKVTIADLCTVIGTHGPTTPQAYPPLLVMIAQAHALTHDMCLTMIGDYEAMCTGTYPAFVNYCNHISAMMAALAGSHLMSSDNHKALDRRLQTWLDECVDYELDDAAEGYDAFTALIEHGNDLAVLYKGSDALPPKRPQLDNALLELLELSGTGISSRVKAGGGGCKCGGTCAGAQAPSEGCAGTAGVSCPGAAGTCGCPAGHDGVEGEPGKD